MLGRAVAGRALRRSGAGAQRGAPQRRERRCGPLGQPGEPVAEARGLAGEHDPAAGAQHPRELGERAVEVGQVVEHRVSEHQVEALVAERQRFGVGARGPYLAARGGPRSWRGS